MWTSLLTLNLCLVHHKVVIVATALVLLPSAALKTLVLVLHVVQREHRRSQPAIAPLSSQDSQRLLLWRSVNVLKPMKTTERKKNKRERPSYLMRADVHAPVHRHVLDQLGERESQADVVRPVETAFEEGTAI